MEGIVMLTQKKQMQSHVKSAVVDISSYRKSYRKKSVDFQSKILNGDVVKCLQDIDKTLKFDVVIADPPYNIGKDFGNNNDYMPIDDYIKWTKQWLDLCFEALADNGLIYVYGFPEILARVAAQYPLETQRILAWHYTNKTTPSLKFWQRSYESILCLWKEQRPALEIDQIREPYTDSYLKCSGKQRKNTQGRFGSKTTVYNVNELGALPRDVIKIPALAGGAGRNERHFMCRTCGNVLYHNSELHHHKGHDILQHPTQKPLLLTEKLIQSRIQGNDGKVLIPFAGSGSECVAAKRLGIDFLGIEINPEYVEYASQWIEKYV
jgi:site-specific DNA-methyltransferase (adenine-specific)